MERFKIFDRTTLKVVALISMLLDHLNKIIIVPLFFYLDNTFLMNLGRIFTIFGRIAFPIFAFFIASGFYYTRDKRKYLFNLLLFAFISEVPYSLLFNGTNILFTFSLALVTIWIIDEIKKRTSFWHIFALFIVIVSSFVSEYFAFDYGYQGILIPVIFYLFYNRRFISTVLGYLIIIDEVWTGLGFGLLNFYNGKSGKQLKWLFYIFYPLHLLVIWLISLVVGI